MAKPPKFKADGEPDLRGHGEGSLSTRFAPGDGRRRPGRPKGAPDEKTLVQSVKDMQVAVNVPGLPRRITTQHAYLLKLREKALRGDTKAIEILDRKFSQYAPPFVQPNLTAELLAEDLEILYGAQLRGAAPLPAAGSGDDDVPPQIEEGSVIGKEEGSGA